MKQYKEILESAYKKARVNAEVASYLRNLLEQVEGDLAWADERREADDYYELRFQAISLVCELLVKGVIK